MGVAVGWEGAGVTGVAVAAVTVPIVILPFDQAACTPLPFESDNISPLGAACVARKVKFELPFAFA